MYCSDGPSAMFHGLHQAHRKRVMEEQGRRGLADLGSPMLLLMLFHGEQRGVDYSQREVAGNMRLSPATVAVSLRSLERAGYVERRADEKDARRNRVALTDRGREAVALCGEVFRAVDAQMLRGFSDGEKAQLTGFFHRMMENLGGVADLPCPPGLGVR